MSPLQICHRCDERQKDCHGPCACTKDGRDIIEHATTHDCPLDLYPPRGAGDVLAYWFSKCGGNVFKRMIERWTGKPCGCAKRQDALNDAFPASKS
jgi:hypothetical protein